MIAESSVVAWPTLALAVHRAALRCFVDVRFAEGQSLRAIEVQRLYIGGRSVVLVATHRPTGELDVFVPVGSGLDEHWVASDPFMAHMRLGTITEIEFRTARCDVSDHLVDAEVDFDDGHGQPVRLAIDHRFMASVKPSFVPTVPGQTGPATLRFMLASLRQLPRRVQRLDVTVNGRPLEVKPYLLPNPVAPLLAARCGSGVFGVGLNLTGSCQVGPEGLGDAESALLVVRDGAFFRFDLLGQATGAGSGRLLVDSSVGPVATGTWTVNRPADGAELTLRNVVQRWFPGWLGGGALLTYLVRRLRRRGEIWTWTGRVDAAEEGVVHHGRWQVDLTGR